MKKVNSITQCLILIVGILAIAYLIGGEVKFVSSSEPEGYFLEDPEGFVDGYYLGGSIGGGAISGLTLGTKNFLGDSLDSGAGDTAKTGETSFLKELFIINEKETILTGFAGAAAWGITAYTTSKAIIDIFGLKSEEADALQKAIGIGTFAGTGTTALLKNWDWFQTDTTGQKIFQFLTEETADGTGWGLSTAEAGVWSGLVVGAIIFLSEYSETETEIIMYDCEPWQAPTGGSNCEDCNNGNLPCSEYQCKSLGQACELLNADDPEEATCEWVNRHDTEYPTIEPWEYVLTTGYEYSPDNTISPPDRGVKIINPDSDDGCVEAFTALSFGIYLDEPGQCKIDYLRKDNYSDMDYYFGGSSNFRYNHTQVMSLPSESALEAENITLYNDGEYTLYVRCMDANGNFNTANFVFGYCVDEGPDTTPTLIVATSIENGQPIAFNQTEVDLEIYVNEPSNCRWSRYDESYEEMDVQMSCSTSVKEMNAQMLYTCTTTLDGLENDEENMFYFRCEDQPNVDEEDRNQNQESYEFSLLGSEDILLITEVLPNETVKGATEPIRINLTVETSDGFNEGVSTCYYSATESESGYIEFYQTDSYEHSQALYLDEGDYIYYKSPGFAKINFRRPAAQPRPIRPRVK